MKNNFPGFIILFFLLTPVKLVAQRSIMVMNADKTPIAILVKLTPSPENPEAKSFESGPDGIVYIRHSDFVRYKYSFFKITFVNPKDGNLYRGRLYVKLGKNENDTNIPFDTGTWQLQELVDKKANLYFVRERINSIDGKEYVVPAE
jgi:hypothetical protein